MENYDVCAAFLEEQMEAAGFDRKNILKVITACEEIIVNVMHYAYGNGEGDLEISFADDREAIRIQFIDRGAPFNPLEKADADISLSAEERSIGGLGILMVKKLMDQVNYEYVDQKNVLTIIKKLPVAIDDMEGRDR